MVLYRALRSDARGDGARRMFGQHEYQASIQLAGFGGGFCATLTSTSGTRSTASSGALRPCNSS